MKRGMGCPFSYAYDFVAHHYFHGALEAEKPLSGLGFRMIRGVR